MRSGFKLILGLAILVSAGSGPPFAEILHLRDGRKIKAADLRETDTQYVFTRFGGTVSISKQEVSWVEKTEARSSIRTAPAGDLQSLPVPFPAPAASENSPPIDPLLRQTLQRAEESRQRKDLPETARLYESVLRIVPAHLEAALYRTSAYLQMGQFPRALAAAQEALLYHSENSNLLFLLGEIHYHQDKLPLAIEYWRKALLHGDHPAIRTRIEKANRELALEGAYERKAGGHFRLRYQGGKGSEDFSESVLNHLEERIGDLSLRLDHFPSGPISVILYPDQEFHAATGAGHNVLGLFDGKIRVPVGGKSRLSPGLRRVLDHELAHAIIDSKSGGTCPRWLHEGLAQRLAGDSSEPFRRNLGREYARMTESGQWNPGLSYPAALSFVDFLSSRHGFQVWLTILQRLHQGKSVEVAFWETVRVSQEELFTEWGENLLERSSRSR